jgi:putative peptide zinc metalloprotease protein
VIPQLASGSWYRVAQLRPRLRSHVRMHRHDYRGVRWHVLEDRISRRSHRLNAAAYYVVGMMDGRRTLQQIWDAALARFGDETPTQDDVIRLFSQLHLADVLQCDLSPDVEELVRRAQRISRRGLMAKLISPLAIRVPLVDPDRWLERMLPWYRPLFGPLGAAAWLLLVGWAALASVQHWGELTQDLSNRVLAPENLLILGLVFPLLKALHELGHACAVKAWGGEVHDMGVMFLVLMPVPYVDASTANAFPSKARRAVVGAAGMAVELAIASAALCFWLEMQPGVLKAVLFNVILIAGVSTVLFNANPLLRFDGYYILADLIDIPNLRQRAQQYVYSFFQRRLFGLAVEAPEATPRERAWFVFFTVGSSIYRVFITLGIAMFLATQYFIVGVVLAIWAVVAGMVLPVVMLLYYLAFSPRLRRHRARAVLSTGGLAAALGALLFAAPVASWTNAQGVLWGAEQWMVRGAAEGFVVKVLAEPGVRVQRGAALIEAADPLLAPRIRVLEAEKEAFEARYLAQRVEENLVAAQGVLERLKVIDAELARARERQRDLVIRSPAEGVFALPAAQDLTGRFLKQGEQIGYVIPEGEARARVLVPQESVDLVRSRTRSVSARLAERPGETLQARIVREVPRASDRLPSAALSQVGGGDLALDPSQAASPRTLQTHFEFEIELLGARALGAGARVYVRFEHEAEPVGWQLWRLLQQLFLQHFAV